MSASTTRMLSTREEQGFQEPLCNFLSGPQLSLCLVNVIYSGETPPSLSQVFTHGCARLGCVSQVLNY